MPLFSSSDSVRSPRRAAAATFPPEVHGQTREDQQVHALWTRIQQATERAPEIDKSVAVNSSLYPCAKNAFQISVEGIDDTKPIHGHRWTISHPDPHMAGRVTKHIYSAAQSPEKDCCDQLIDALDSGRGIYEFVSPKAIRGGHSKHGPSIVQMVVHLKSANPPGKLYLGGRYELIGFDRIDGSHLSEDVVHYQLVARDIKSNTQRIVPVTQVGLRFDGRALQNKEILRANDALESHQQLCREQGKTAATPLSSDDDNSIRYSPLIISHAGIGRNAALITFSDIHKRILEDRSVDRNNLDETLLEIITMGRQARGPRFLHTRDQLKVVRQMLLALIDDVEKNDARNSVEKLASTDQANRHRLMQSVELSALRDTDRQPTSTSKRGVPTVDSAAITGSHTSEVTKMQAKIPSHFGFSATSNVRQVPSTATRLTDESSGQPGQAAMDQPAAYATTTTDVPSDDAAHPSDIAPAGTVSAARPSRERITRQHLRELAPYPLIDPHDPLGNRTVYPLIADTFNMQAISTRLNFRRAPGDCSTGTHFVKGLAGVDEGCWWRAVWLSALLQHAHSFRQKNFLEDSIVHMLGEQFRPEAHIVTKMIHAIRQEGYFAIVLQDIGGKDEDDEYMRLCQLGLAMENARAGESVEDMLKKLTNALLEASGCDEYARYPLIASQPGGDELMPTLCHQLQADMVLFVDLSDVEDTAQPYLHVLAQDTSPLNSLDADRSSPDSLTDALMTRLAQIPVITAQGSHFDVAIPRAFNPGHLGRPLGKN